MTEKLDEQAIKEVCSLRPELSEEMIREFDEALQSFFNSPRFQVMKPLLLRRFLEKDMEKDAFEAMDEELHRLTLGELPDLGTLELCLKPGMTADSIKTLTSLLKALGTREGGVVEGEEFMDPLHSIPVGFGVFPEETEWDHDVQDTMPSGMFARQGGQTVVAGDSLPNEANTVSSIEEESLLKDTLVALRSSEYFRHFKRDKVGDYWDTSGLRAPFLESMTWEQLTSIETAILMQKRIYNQRKTFGILDAAKKVLLQYDDTSVQLPTPKHEQQEEAKKKPPVGRPQAVDDAAPERIVPKAPPSMKSLTVLPWCETMPGILWPYYALSVEMVQRLQGHDVPFVHFITALHQQVRVESQLMGMLLPSSGEALLKSMICANAQCSISIEETAEHWCVIAEQAAPGLFDAFKTALAAPLVDEESLLRPHLVPDVPLRYQRMMLLGLAFSMGARPASWRKDSLCGCWTRTPKTLGLVLQELESNLPLPEDAMKKLSEDLLPAFHFDALRSWFERLFVFDAGEGIWRAHNQH